MTQTKRRRGGKQTDKKGAGGENRVKQACMPILTVAGEANKRGASGSAALAAPLNAADVLVGDSGEAVVAGGGCDRVARASRASHHHRPPHTAESTSIQTETHTHTRGRIIVSLREAKKVRVYKK